MTTETVECRCCGEPWSEHTRVQHIRDYVIETFTADDVQIDDPANEGSFREMGGTTIEVRAYLMIELREFEQWLQKEKREHEQIATSAIGRRLATEHGFRLAD